MSYEIGTNAIKLFLHDPNRGTLGALLHAFDGYFLPMRDKKLYYLPDEEITVSVNSPVLAVKDTFCVPITYGAVRESLEDLASDLSVGDEKELLAYWVDKLSPSKKKEANLPDNGSLEDTTNEAIPTTSTTRWSGTDLMFTMLEETIRINTIKCAKVETKAHKIIIHIGANVTTKRDRLKDIVTASNFDDVRSGTIWLNDNRWFEFNQESMSWELRGAPNIPQSLLE